MIINITSHDYEDGAYYISVDQFFLTDANRATQTDRFILLGPAQKSIRVPQIVGWDHFKRSQTKEEDTSTISSGGTCRCDDHPGMAGWVCRNRIECSYPQGAPVNVPPKEDSIEGQAEVSTEDDAMPGNAPVVVLEDPPVGGRYARGCCAGGCCAGGYCSGGCSRRGL
jgi:hypothetical protein